MIIDLYKTQPDDKINIKMYSVNGCDETNDGGDVFSFGIDMSNSDNKSYTSFTYNNSSTIYITTGSYFYDPLWSM